MKTIVCVWETGGKTEMGWSVWLAKVGDSVVRPGRQNLINVLPVKRFLSRKADDLPALMGRANSFAKQLGEFLGLEVHEGEAS